MRLWILKNLTELEKQLISRPSADVTTLKRVTVEDEHDRTKIFSIDNSVVQGPQAQDLKPLFVARSSHCV